MAELVEAPDDLYGVDLADFVRERNALAARLKAAGDTEAAAAVRAALRGGPRWACGPSEGPGRYGDMVMAPVAPLFGGASFSEGSSMGRPLLDGQAVKFAAQLACALLALAVA